MSTHNNITGLRRRVAVAARCSGRTSDDIALMAVTKTVPPERIREAYDAGVRVFGENRVQEFAAKSDALRDLIGSEWHMIGHLQANKSAMAAELFGFVDSLDSLRLAKKLNAAASGLHKTIPVLIEINIGGEAAKSGVAPHSSELEDILKAATELSSLDLRGLMTVPPYSDDPEQSRPYFRKMRQLFEQIANRKLTAVRMEVLSMGMSHDFEVAIEEGATCVRIGTAIFGERQPGI